MLSESHLRDESKHRQDVAQRDSIFKMLFLLFETAVDTKKIKNNLRNLKVTRIF
jgi:hypothetical protein